MEQRVIKALGEKDRHLAKEIQESMFTFETLILMDDRSMQTLLRNVDQEILIIALKGTDDELKEKYSTVCPERAAANIKDEMEVLGPIRLTEVQEAQKAVINVAELCLMKVLLFLLAEAETILYDAVKRTNYRK